MSLCWPLGTALGPMLLISVPLKLSLANLTVAALDTRVTAVLMFFSEKMSPVL